MFRKDRGRPSSDTLSLETFNTNQIRWKIDPAGMIVKCAESSALRKAFPTQLGGLRTSTADAEPMQGGDEVIDSVPAIEHHADSVEPGRATEDADAPEVDMALNEYRSSFGGCRDITSVNKMEEVLIGESEIRFQGPALDLVKQSLKEQADARREEIRAARGSK